MDIIRSHSHKYIRKCLRIIRIMEFSTRCAKHSVAMIYYYAVNNYGFFSNFKLMEYMGDTAL